MVHITMERSSCETCTSIGRLGPPAMDMTNSQSLLLTRAIIHDSRMSRKKKKNLKFCQSSKGRELLPRVTCMEIRVYRADVHHSASAFLREPIRDEGLSVQVSVELLREALHLQVPHQRRRHRVLLCPFFLSFFQSLIWDLMG